MASYDSDKVAHIHEELHSHLPPESALRVKKTCGRRLAPARGGFPAEARVRHVTPDQHDGRGGEVRASGSNRCTFAADGLFANWHRLSRRFAPKSSAALPS